MRIIKDGDDTGAEITLSVEATIGDNNNNWTSRHLHVFEFDGRIYVELNQDHSGYRMMNTPDLQVSIKDIDKLMVALEWARADRLGRMAIEQEHCGAITTGVNDG